MAKPDPGPRAKPDSRPSSNPGPGPGPSSAQRSAAAAGILLQRIHALPPSAGASELHALSTQLLGLDDPHRRLSLALELLDRPLQHPSTLTPADPADPADYADLPLALLDTALELLDREPREPQLLARGSKLLAMLGAAQASEALHDALFRLDADTAALLSDEHARPASLLGPIGTTNAAPALQQLSHRAIDIAARALPLTGLQLSLCMIVRDEQEMLARCLSSIADLVDEIVLVDTGSVDATLEIARSYGARVFSSGWQGSFAQARNVSFDAAKGDWIIFLDADEALLPGDRQRLRSLLTQTWCEAFRMSIINHTGSLSDPTSVTHSALRMFRNRPQYRFAGRLHEQIEQLPSFLASRLRDSGIRIEHYGYLDSVREQRQKSKRNMELLRLQQAEGPPSAFLHFNLGSEHAAAGDHQTALLDFQRAWELLRHTPDPSASDFAPVLIKRLSASLRACGRDADAFARAKEGLQLFPEYTDLVFEQALASAANGHADTAIELLERCLQMGEPPTRYPSSSGCGSFLAQMQLADLRGTRGEAGPAIALLEKSLRAHPHHARAGSARVALAELLIAQQRYWEASQALAHVATHDSHALAAIRTRIFALIAGGERAGDEAFEHARSSRMSASELDLFRAWDQLEHSGHTDITLSLAAVPRLLAMLETLLTAQDFQSFESLLRLLPRSSLSQRERREAMACMYLRRGFLASAAEEWMSVCHQAPDQPALLGLARVALAQGMPADAADFATAALDLDPTDQAALALLAELRGSSQAGLRSLPQVKARTSSQPDLPLSGHDSDAYSTPVVGTEA